MDDPFGPLTWSSGNKLENPFHLIRWRVIQPTAGCKHCCHCERFHSFVRDESQKPGSVTRRWSTNFYCSKNRALRKIRVRGKIIEPCINERSRVRLQSGQIAPEELIPETIPSA